MRTLGMRTRTEQYEDVRYEDTHREYEDARYDEYTLRAA